MAIEDDIARIIDPGAFILVDDKEWDDPGAERRKRQDRLLIAKDKARAILELVE